MRWCDYLHVARNVAFVASCSSNIVATWPRFSIGSKSWQNRSRVVAREVVPWLRTCNEKVTESPKRGSLQAGNFRVYRAKEVSLSQMKKKRRKFHRERVEETKGKKRNLWKFQRRVDLSLSIIFVSARCSTYVARYSSKLFERHDFSIRNSWKIAGVIRNLFC